MDMASSLSHSQCTAHIGERLNVVDTWFCTGSLALPPRAVHCVHCCSVYLVVTDRYTQALPVQCAAGYRPAAECTCDGSAAFTLPSWPLAAGADSCRPRVLIGMLDSSTPPTSPPGGSDRRLLVPALHLHGYE